MEEKSAPGCGTSTESELTVWGSAVKRRVTVAVYLLQRGDGNETWKVTVDESTGNCVHRAMGLRREEKVGTLLPPGGSLPSLSTWFGFF